MSSTTGYDQIDLGMDPGSRSRHRPDGLTDAFEQLAGTSPDVADTDQDGLSDAYEVAVSGTDGLRADTDADGLTDSTEEAVGTSGTQWDTDLDGASDGVEVRYDADPLVAEHAVSSAPRHHRPPPSRCWPATAATGRGSSLADAFVQTAVNQRGDRYVFGAEASLDDPDPDVFDCSELTQWAADQVGVTIPDGAMYQYLDLKDQGQLMSVDEALRTKGALLFYFSSEPTAAGGRPSSAPRRDQPRRRADHRGPGHELRGERVPRRRPLQLRRGDPRDERHGPGGPGDAGVHVVRPDRPGCLADGVVGRRR